MSSLKRKKVKTTPFSNFIRYASISEKQTFFEKVRNFAIEDQRQVIAKAEELKYEKAK